MPKCVTIWRKSEKRWGASVFQGGSEFTWASEGPQNGGKMTGMDLLEFRDINGPYPMPKMVQFGRAGAWCGFPPAPVS